MRVSTQAEEAQLTAGTIRELLQQQVPPSDILCLFRSNTYRTMLEIELARAGIPFRLLQGSREPAGCFRTQVRIQALIASDIHGFGSREREQVLSGLANSLQKGF